MADDGECRTGERPPGGDPGDASWRAVGCAANAGARPTGIACGDPCAEGDLADLVFRFATRADIPALNALIRESAAALSAGFYSAEETNAAIRYVFGVDTMLVDDQTYFVASLDGADVACGGWSRRGALYGGDQRRMEEAPLLDPRADAARIRAFFVSPRFARRGIGRRMLDHCIAAAVAEGFSALELMATLPGVPLYEQCGFRELERVIDTMPNGVGVRFVRMRRELPSPSAP